jgi:hypothetical protein
MKGDPFRRFLHLTRRLEEANIYYELRQVREDAIMIHVRVPGERWEIEFVDYGDEVQVEIERFRSKGKIDDESALEELFNKFSDAEEATSGEAVKRNGATSRK